VKKSAPVLFLGLVFALGFAAPLLADTDSGAGLFPSAHELFLPLIANPRELQYAIRFVMPVGKHHLGEASVGDYFGIYRWNFGKIQLQSSVGGGMFGRFDLSKYTNDLQITDWYLNLPFDVRVGLWAHRLMIYHTSSHLGDDYIRESHDPGFKHAWDSLQYLLSYDWNPMLRLYGGPTYVFRSLPKDDRNAIELGFETQSRWFSGRHMRVYWANDFQSWERTEWNPTFNTQAGITFAKTPESLRQVSLFVEYMTGRQVQGQFYLHHESRWNLGLRLSIG
jgi:hypothetical protein